MNARLLFAALLLAASGCGGADATDDGVPSTESPTTATPTAVPELADGPVTPGRYRFTIRNVCEEGDLIGCPEGIDPPPPLDLEVTVPAGWQHWRDFGVITPDTGDDATAGPDGAALVMGWTTFFVGLNSDPCLSEAHEIPDIDVGPSVGDFVDAVQAHNGLDVTAPKDVELGGYPGRFFSLRGPADISQCDNWRPWDPGFYVQGPNNLWDVWVIDVAGDRVLIVTQHFPDTPTAVTAQLQEMAQSIEFLP